MARPLILSFFFATVQPVSSSYCSPGDSCWPSAAEWRDLNTSVTGLLAGLVAGECDGPVAFERSSDPSCMMYEATEHADVSLQEQRIYPQYVLHVAGAVDIEKAEAAVASTVQFAVHHRIRLTVKTTGHDFQGRSNAPDGILVWLHGFKSAKIVQDYSDGCTSGETAVEVQGGAQWNDVYPLVDEAGFQVVGGFSTTVSVAGGYLQGAGHSALSPSYGTAVDNVLSLKVVTMDGKVRSVSPCENTDLFFALRGGGGGTFGIVTSVVLRLHQPPKYVVGWNWDVPLKEKVSGDLTPFAEEWMKMYLKFQPQVDRCWGGFLNSFNGIGRVQMVCNGNWSTAVRSTEAMKAWHDRTQAAYPSQHLVWKMTNFSSYWKWRISMATNSPVGMSLAVSSRLVPLDKISGSSTQAMAALILRHLPVFLPADQHFLMLVKLGGAVAEMDPNGTTAVSPAFRNAHWHMIMNSGYGYSDRPFSDEAGAFARVTSWRDDLEAHAPEGGAYWNEMLYNEPNWQQTIWGPLYEKLLNIKHRYDPTGHLNCHHCVGSEEVREFAV